MTRAAVAFPGRSSYAPGSLGSLPAGHTWVRRADELRAGFDLPPLSEIDAAERFDPAVHLRAANAAPLAFLCGLLDAERIADDHEVVVVVASSTGWATALAASGALGFDDSFRLVQEMALLAESALPDGSPPGELIHLLTDEAWRVDEARTRTLDEAMAAADGPAHRTLELGPYVVVGGSREAVDHLGAALPPVAANGRKFPLRLAMAETWHTPLRAPAVEMLTERMGALAWEAPNVTLVDGRGARFTPSATDPDALAAYTLGEHVTTPYDFTAGFRAALREYAPDAVLLPGPGSSLGAACAQLIVSEGYRGIRSREEFEASQGGPSPILLSMRR